MTTILEKLAAKRLAREIEQAGGTRPDTVKPVATSGITAPANAFKGAIRPSQPTLSAETFKEILDRKDKVPEKSRIGKPGYTHVSTVCGEFCRRHYTLNAIHGRVDWEAVTGGHRLMWAFGRTAEKHIRAHLTDGNTFGMQVYGKWECRCGLTSHVGTKPHLQKTCPRCTLPLDQYFEEPWFDHDYKIVGNPDLGVFLGSYYLPIEIKSASQGIWDKLTEPMTEHVNQALLYRYLAQKAGLTVHDKVLIIYAKKEFVFKSPYKAFDVDVTERRWQGVLERSLEVAAELRDAIANKTPVRRLSACADITSRKASKCPAAALCFNLSN